MLLLVNRHPDANVSLLLELAKPLHRNAQTTAVRVEHNKLCDICAILSTDKVTARNIVESSEDYIKMRAKAWIDLVDTEETIEDTKARRLLEIEKMKDAVISDPVSAQTSSSAVVAPLPVQGTSEPPPDIKMAPLPYVPQHYKEKLIGDGERMPPTFITVDPSDPSRMESDSQLAETGDALEGSVRAQVDDAIPSSKWPREKLLEYAKKRGMDVPDNMSKNAILRKIRGV